MLVFTNINDLHAAIAEQGLPPLPDDIIEQIEAITGIKLERPEVGGEQASPAQEADAEVVMTLRAESELEALQDRFDSYVEFSTEQVIMLGRQRNELAEQLSTCHSQECVDAQVHEARVRGYADCSAYVLYSTAFDLLPAEVQAEHLAKAEAAIAKLDEFAAENRG